MSDDKLALLPFKESKKLKKLGFDWNCNYYRRESAAIDDKRILSLKCGSSRNWNNYSKYIPYYSIPTQSLVIKWLRETHNIEVIVSVDFQNASRNLGRFYDVVCYLYDDKKRNLKYLCKKLDYETYEKAELVGIRESIKHLQKLK